MALVGHFYFAAVIALLAYASAYRLRERAIRAALGQETHARFRTSKDPVLKDADRDAAEGTQASIKSGATTTNLQKICLFSDTSKCLGRPTSTSTGWEDARITELDQAATFNLPANGGYVEMRASGTDKCLDAQDEIKSDATIGFYKCKDDYQYSELQNERFRFVNKTLSVFLPVRAVFNSDRGKYVYVYSMFCVQYDDKSGRVHLGASVEWDKFRDDSGRHADEDRSTAPAPDCSGDQWKLVDA
eukprot:TRINITY_DN20703_c0_g1_i1.p1 TRINITY_DN20703_c0_g1~~TRINITY_DN20703_c0_g1_i1.p1  ORF type:complete len:274 (+),score=16.43 TRINITY_DN20703_c0_g1_i1:90-824(+)